MVDAGLVTVTMEGVVDGVLVTVTVERIGVVVESLDRVAGGTITGIFFGAVVIGGGAVVGGGCVFSRGCVSCGG